MIISLIGIAITTSVMLADDLQLFKQRSREIISQMKSKARRRHIGRLKLTAE